jgi:hypothetical protein
MAEEVGLRGYRVQDPARTQARRREIMLAMAEVIIEKSYASATLEDVATHMGTSRAVIYYQFRSKEDLLIAGSWWKLAARPSGSSDPGARASPEQALYAAMRTSSKFHGTAQPEHAADGTAEGPLVRCRARIKFADRACRRLSRASSSTARFGVFTTRTRASCATP